MLQQFYKLILINYEKIFLLLFDIKYEINLYVIGKQFVRLKLDSGPDPPH
jgi:hypothetical protein